MADNSSDLVQGTLDMLILKTLQLERMHGWGIAQRIEQIGRVFPGQPWIALSSVSPPAEGWVAETCMAHNREPSAGEVLLVDGVRAQEAGVRDVGLEAAVDGDHTDS